MKREAKFQTLFKHYLQSKKYHGYPGAFELKRSLTDSLPFSDVKPHQVEALVASSDKGLYYKISDESRGEKPFDCFFLAGIPSFVVIAYGKQLKSFVMIPIETWVAEKKKSVRKSLTYNRAVAIGELVVI